MPCLSYYHKVLTVVMKAKTAPHDSGLEIALHRDLADGFGLRLRTGWTWENFDAAMSAIRLGTAARSGIVGALEGIMRTTGPDGEPEAWSVSAALEGLILTAFEANPRVNNAADLQSWLR